MDKYHVESWRMARQWDDWREFIYTFNVCQENHKRCQEKEKKNSM